MGFHLVHSGCYLGKMNKVKITVGIKIGNADGSRGFFLIGLLHGPIGAIVIAKGLMDQQQIHIIRPQLFKRRFDRSFCLLKAGV